MEKTKCQDIEPLLDGLYDGELTAGELIKTQTHVGQCADCQAKLAQIETVSHSLSRLPKLSAKKDYAEEILAKAKARESKADNVVAFPRKKLWTAVAAGFLIIGIGYALSTSERLDKVAVQPVEKNEKISLPGKQAQPSTPTQKEASELPVRRLKRKLYPKIRLAEEETAPKSQALIASSTADEVIAYDEGYQPNLMEGMGIATDEDGLYALKM